MGTVRSEVMSYQNFEIALELAKKVTDIWMEAKNRIVIVTNVMLTKTNNGWIYKMIDFNLKPYQWQKKWIF